MQDDVQAVQRLLGQGADVDAQNQFSHYTALMTAIHRNHGEIVQILLDAGADFNFQTESGITPLMVASRDVIPGRDIIVAELLERGADLNVRNGDGDRAINIAVESHNLNVRDFALTDPEQILVMFHSIPGKWRAQLDVIQLLVSTRLKNE